MKLGLNELPLVTRAWHGDSIMCGFALACVKSVFGDVACLLIFDFLLGGRRVRLGIPLSRVVGRLLVVRIPPPTVGGQK